MKNIVETASDAGLFRTLLKAMQEAGLVETLTGEGPYTVFAPTDDAFAKLPDGTLEDVLRDKEKLTDILTYHVITEKVMSDAVTQLSHARTANGKDLRINTNNGVRIGNAQLIQKDLECSNGVIHVIDTVLIP